MVDEMTSAERTFLIGASVKGSRPLLPVENSLQELALLADTAGLMVVGQASQAVQRIDPATFIGSGKLEEIINQLDELDAHVVIFDDELSPRHQRELEKRFGEEVKLLDRSALILDIFANHAHTREGALQVELAQYEYRLPRLTRQWTHLARQAGGGGVRGGVAGVGLRGPGETQLEVDKREIRRKISHLRTEIERVRMHRSQHRTQRKKTGIPVVALVGYTNAGKSTLLNTMTGADVYVADQLFATLDPTTRRIELSSGRNVVLTDTVGFIQKLPTTLIAAFRATLEEIAEANLLLHVVDASHPDVLAHIEVVDDTLAAIEIPDIPRILVWNKMDLWQGSEFPQFVGDDDYSAQIGISAVKKSGIAELNLAIEQALSQELRAVKLLIPYERGDLVSQLHNWANVENQEHTPDGALLTVHLPPSMRERYKSFEVKKT